MMVKNIHNNDIILLLLLLLLLLLACVYAFFKYAWYYISRW